MEDDEESASILVGAWPNPVPRVEDPSTETMLLWGLQQPTLSPPNVFVRQGSLQLCVDACGHQLLISQSPSSLSKPGVTGAVVWDSGVILAKFLEFAVDSKKLQLKEKKCIELGSGCGLVGCVAALLGARVILTDQQDRLKLLQKNVSENAESLIAQGSATVMELTWGDELDKETTYPHPEFVLASDVIYTEAVVPDLLHTLKKLCNFHTTIFLSGELRDDAVLECFYESARKDFVLGRVPVSSWHPKFQSPRVVIYVMCLKPKPIIISYDITYPPMHAQVLAGSDRQAILWSLIMHK